MRRSGGNGRIDCHALYIEVLGCYCEGFCRDNLGMIIYCINPDSEQKKKHVAIVYHELWERAASWIVNHVKVCMKINPADILTKSKMVGTLGRLSDASY